MVNEKTMIRKNVSINLSRDRSNKKRDFIKTGKGDFHVKFHTCMYK